MPNRPSFQFYPKDWRANSKLRRCSPGARGVWIDILCALHDSDEYGIARYPLKELANEVGATLSLVRELVEKGVLKGTDTGEVEAFIYVPRSGRKAGPPVVLIAVQTGPLWYSSRMVKDEYVNTHRGEGTRFGDAPKASPMPSPIHREGDGPSTATATAIEKNKTLPAKAGEGRFTNFWNSWPATERRSDRKKCLAKWRLSKLDDAADEIIAHVAAMKLTRKWSEGFEPAPLRYLNGEQWKDGTVVQAQDRFAGAI